MQAVESKNNQKMSLPASYKVVADIIQVGKKNATLLSDIMIIADIREKRHAYEIIERLINVYGYPIVASRTGKYKGYYFPANEKEFTEARNTLKANIASLKKRYNNLAKNYYGQE